jgi:putative ABC transport system permease protein
MKYLVQVLESLRFALEALRTNLLRTVLSLLSVTIGIFCIIAVLTFVDSMNRSIVEQLDGLGKGVMYVTKFPWSFTNDYPWWKYINRPRPSYREYKFLEENLTKAQAVSVDDGIGNVTAKRGNNSFGLSFLEGFTYNHNQMEDIVVEKGRYFLPQEMESAQNIVILGAEVASTLFAEFEEPTGQEVRLNGIKFIVVGVAKRKGKDPLGIGGDLDSKAMIPYQTFAKIFQRFEPDPNICVKAYPSDKGEFELEGEIRGLMRSYRGIRPIEDDDFSINRLDGAKDFFESIFAALTLGGWCIGGFAVLIGGFGVANIMFVSVKERTNIIGIQKSLGAKSYFVLYQFLFEAVLLCLIGGLFGILFVKLITLAAGDALSFPLILSTSNIMLGLGVSTFLGVIFGILPAQQASRMNPVDAIRSK